MEEEDIDLGITKVRGAKQGRRAARSTDLDLSTEQLEQPEFSDTKASVLDNKNRKSGWGEAPRRGRNKLNMEDLDTYEDERLKPKTYYIDDESDNDTPVIPELVDENEEEITTQIAAAPTTVISKMVTYRELDNDLKQASFLTLDSEIDLRLLTRCLCPDIDLTEEDKPWEWDHLFTDVTSDLRSQSELTEE